MPMRMSRLPINARGYPVPYFVPESGDFRAADPDKFEGCIKNKLCWLCGTKLGQYLCFVLGPMCTVNRVTSEPPCHLECAVYAVQACPFLSNPRMRRNEIDVPDGTMAGEPLLHNPGVTAIWITKGYRLKKVDGGVLFSLKEPTNVIWYTEGRLASRGEVLEAIYRGLPDLEQLVYVPAEKEALTKSVAAALHWVPKEDDDNAGSARHGEHDREGVRCGEPGSGDDGPTPSR